MSPADTLFMRSWWKSGIQVEKTVQGIPDPTTYCCALLDG